MSDRVWTPEDIAKLALGGAVCSDHRYQGGVPEWDDVERVVAASAEGLGDWDVSTEAILLLKDGRYATAWEWSDSSGHGCQCDGAVVFSDSVEAALQGIDGRAAERLKAVLDAS